MYEYRKYISTLPAAIATLSRTYQNSIFRPFFVFLYVKTIRERFRYSPEYILEVQTPQSIVVVAYTKLSFRINLKWSKGRRSDAVFMNIWCNTFFFPGTKSVTQSIPKLCNPSLYSVWPTQTDRQQQNFIKNSAVVYCVPKKFYDLTVHHIQLTLMHLHS